MEPQNQDQDQDYTDATPKTIPIEKAPEKIPPTVPLIHNVHQIGHNLSKTIIHIIALICLVAMTILTSIDVNHKNIISKSLEFVQENTKNNSQKIKEPELKILSEIISKSESNTIAQRALLLEILEIVLVNIILPIFTAIIGYTLGKNKQS